MADIHLISPASSNILKLARDFGFHPTFFFLPSLITVKAILQMNRHDKYACSSIPGEHFGTIRIWHIKYMKFRVQCPTCGASTHDKSFSRRNADKRATVQKCRRIEVYFGTEISEGKVHASFVFHTLWQLLYIYVYAAWDNFRTRAQSP